MRRQVVGERSADGNQFARDRRAAPEREVERVRMAVAESGEHRIGLGCRPLPARIRRLIARPGGPWLLPGALRYDETRRRVAIPPNAGRFGSARKISSEDPA
jgi:hypothetical protein